MTEPREPRTAAGRALLEDWKVANDYEPSRIPAILAIEDEGLDVDRLNRAMWNVLDGQGRATVLYPEDSRAIAAEYARLAADTEAGS